MNLAEYSIKNSVVTWVITAAMVGVGVIAFNGLSRLEDPEFTIKDAVILTPYDGASAAEVEQEVSNVIEKAVQEMGQLKRVESRSSRGLSYVKVTMKDKYDKFALPQVWDELRRKVGDYQRNLPPGAGPSIVNDDFGDVYGVYLAITGDGYGYADLYAYAKFLQRELLQVQDVKRVSILANRPEVIYVETRREKMAELGVSPQEIFAALSAKNLVASAGQAVVGHERVPINPTGEFMSEEQFGDLLVRGGGGSDALVFLRDVADIVRGYQDPPSKILRYDGKAAIGLGISTVQGGNVVTMGNAIDERLRQLLPQAPLGIDLNVISLQSVAVTAAINGFLVSLAQAIAIVVVVLMFFMGLRSGLIIGTILLVTILGTFIVMSSQGIILERISLGALVIALGMLVDNAIVVTDGMRVKMDQGENPLQAAKDVVGQTGTPLLGATVIAIAAFGAIGLSQDSTGEFCRSLFQVILISLMLSWFTAVTTTPLFCKTFLKQKKPSGGEAKDPYGGVLFRVYRSFLTTSIRFRWVTILVVVATFATALFGFGFVKQSFFPDSTRPQFLLDLWFPEGQRIEETEARVAEAERYLLGVEGVTHTSSAVGGGHTRFLLTYGPEKNWEAYAQIICDVDDYRKVSDLIARVERELPALLPEARVSGQKFIMGPGEAGKIRVRVSGPDPEVLIELASRAQRILEAHPDTKNVRNDWRSKVKVLRPQMAETQARNAGIERPQLAAALESAIDGTPIGVYREDDELLRIVARSPEYERSDFSNLQSIPVWSPAAQQMIPMGQVVSGFETVFEDPYLWRRNRNLTITVFADPRTGLASEVFQDVKVEIEQALGVDLRQITGRADTVHEFGTIRVVDEGYLPLFGMTGYSMAWGGQAEDSARAQAGLASNFPPILGVMIFIVIFLFNSLKKTAIIWLCVPLAIIGVAAGLLLTNQPFGFMSLLGLLSLSGMLIKNAIVLIDQIGIEIDSGKDPHNAIVDSGVSRLIPVLMAAVTTILGLVPLLPDAFFKAMAVTIMFGLGFATILTLIVVPVLYAVFFRIPSPR